MEIAIIQKNEVTLTELPEKFRGKYPINIRKGQKLEPLLYVEGKKDAWQILPNPNITVVQPAGVPLDKIKIVDDTILSLKDSNGNLIILVAEETAPEILTYEKYKLPRNGKLTIGRDASNTIQYNLPFMDKEHALIEYKNNPNGKQTIVFSEIGDNNNRTKNGSFINLKRFSQGNLNYGDVFYFMGLKIIVTKDYIAINNPNQKVKVNLEPLEDNNVKVLNKEPVNPERDFSISPRQYKQVEKLQLSPSSPPTQREERGVPWLYTFGPSIAMGLASLMTSYYSISNVIATNGDITQAIPSLVLALAMLFGTIICPFLAKNWEKRTYKKALALAELEYSNEIKALETQIQRHAVKQKQIIEANNPSIEALIRKIDEKETRSNKNNESNFGLWERNTRHDDFLDIALGRGDILQDVEINVPNIPKETTKNSKQYLNKFTNELRIVPNVPITFSLNDKPFLGVIGNRKKVIDLVKAAIVELTTLHSYDDLKLAFIYDESEKDVWDFTKWLPHTWSNDMEENYIATNFEQLKDLSNTINNVIDSREKLSDVEIKYETPHYVIIAANRTLAEKAMALKRLYSLHKNVRISVVALYNEKKYLPRSYDDYIEISANTAKIVDLNNTSDKPKVIQNIYQYPNNLNDVAIKLANTKLDVVTAESSLPEQYSLMDMFEVNKPSEFDAFTKWTENDATKSLAVPLGIDADGYQVMLDIHEKEHGPHGLIAGMTGSGKSEFIISYIASLAMNFSPDDVSFILVDFKGGGMGDTFKNLPHVVGTVTNLDGNELNRSLLAIESELINRQTILKEASEKYDISNIDIYRYQEIRKDLLEKGEEIEALPHLVIIVDEFAELKQQNPDFLDQLIRIARIGRSLGVHMILATQKPDGVVNDQITSNIRFKVCLKVQSAADSKSMLGVSDAATLKRSGQFYLQVGYNEIFENGQSAWAGAPYIENDKYDSSHNYSLKIFDSSNNELAELDTLSLRPKDANSSKQIDLVVNYLQEVAQENGFVQKKLWIPPLEAPELASPEDEELETSFDNLIFQIGLYDDVAHQEYKPLNVDFINEGNLLIYGAAGSGKLEVLNKLLYEGIKNNNPEDIEFNILDFGSGSLSGFRNAPHVKNIFIAESEKAGEYLDNLKREFERRKKLFIPYGGNFVQYIKSSGNKIPAIINVVNNFTNFNNIMEDYSYIIEELSREGSKYGIFFVLTGTTSNSINYRLSPHFKQILVLQENNEDEYYNILGRHDNLIPSPYLGRGLIKLNQKTYEFQTDIIFKEKGNRFKAIDEYCISLSGGSTENYNNFSSKNLYDYSYEKFNELTENYFSDNWILGFKEEGLLEKENTFGIQPFIFTDEINERGLEFLEQQLLQSYSNIIPVKQDDLFFENGYKKFIEQLYELIVARNKEAREAKSRGEEIPDFDEITFLISDYMDFLVNMEREDYQKWLQLAEFIEPALKIGLIAFVDEKNSTKLTDLIYKGIDSVDSIWIGSNFENDFLNDKLPQGKKNNLTENSVIIVKNNKIEIGEIPF